MDKLSEHFSRSEFKSKNDKWVNDFPIDYKLIIILEKIRNHFDKPVYINSGYRSPEYNATLKNASSTSYHCKGMAADFVIKEINLNEVAQWIDEFCLQGTGGIIIYKTFIHCDTRSKIYRDNRV